MKLSEAIRLGAMLKPQAFGTAFSSRGTCALGGAMDAVGALDETYNETFPILCARFGWPVTILQSAVCPACGRVRRTFDTGTIPHLNDDHRWTREQIADFVERFEARQALVPIPEDAQQKVTA